MTTNSQNQRQKTPSHKDALVVNSNYISGQASGTPYTIPELHPKSHATHPSGRD
jgi:hypothetical protein